ncbi:unnamed protein product [Prorocentrum cordatum]|uniref:Potassium channel tetramerisation-type BTB domain-containing protein n=1 Tax=Prorocentrum cordatum TaxID=2364126 RepID=A0ABN9TCU6_9DINO|nr:unnamed protein product [Polarella glacialis]
MSSASIDVPTPLSLPTDPTQLTESARRPTTTNSSHLICSGIVSRMESKPSQMAGIRTLLSAHVPRKSAPSSMMNRTEGYPGAIPEHELRGQRTMATKQTTPIEQPWLGILAVVLGAPVSAILGTTTAPLARDVRRSARVVTGTSGPAPVGKTRAVTRILAQRLAVVPIVLEVPAVVVPGAMEVAVVAILVTAAVPLAVDTVALEVPVDVVPIMLELQAAVLPGSGCPGEFCHRLGYLAGALAAARDAIAWPAVRTTSYPDCIDCITFCTKDFGGHRRGFGIYHAAGGRLGPELLVLDPRALHILGETPKAQLEILNLHCSPLRPILSSSRLQSEFVLPSALRKRPKLGHHRHSGMAQHAALRGAGTWLAREPPGRLSRAPLALCPGLHAAGRCASAPPRAAPRRAALPRRWNPAGALAGVPSAHRRAASAQQRRAGPALARDLAECIAAWQEKGWQDNQPRQVVCSPLGRPRPHGRREECTADQEHHGPVLSVNIGGAIFRTTANTLRKAPFFDLMLRHMEEGALGTTTDDSGQLFVDRSGDLFVYILEYLRSGHWILRDRAGDLEFVDALREEARERAGVEAAWKI